MSQFLIFSDEVQNFTSILDSPGLKRTYDKHRYLLEIRLSLDRRHTDLFERSPGLPDGLPCAHSLVTPKHRREDLGVNVALNWLRQPFQRVRVGGIRL